jgi:acetyl esterase/lipase
MEKRKKWPGITASLIVCGVLAYSWLLPGALRQAAAQDAAPGNTIYVPLAASDASNSAVTEEQNYTVNEEAEAVEAAAVTADGVAVLRPSLLPSYTVSVTQDVVYGAALLTQNNVLTPTKLLLDLYEPANAPAGLRPTILIVHGGAFVRGSRREANLVRAANEYASRGYVVAAMGYRLGGGPNFATTGQLGPFPLVSGRVQPYQALVNGVASIRFLDFITNTTTLALLNPLVRTGQAAAMDDTLTAIDWLNGQAQSRQLDLSRLVLMGGSAGAIDSLHTAYALDDLGIPVRRIAAVLDFWGAFNLDDTNVASDGVVFMEKREPPVFIVHGTADVEVPILYGYAIFARAKQVKVPSHLIVVPDGRHGFNNINIFTTLANRNETIFQRSVRFLDTILFRSSQVTVTD